MDVYSTEEQQVEAIKTWWRDNAMAVVIGAVVGLGGLYGWRYYQSEQEIRSEQVSEAYIEVLDAMNTDPAKAQENADAFILKNPGAYAQILELQQAKVFVELKDYPNAALKLRAVQMSKDEILKTIASFRLARIEAEQGNYPLALAELDKVTAQSWKAQREELRGDIEFKMGDMPAAREAYLASIGVAPNPVVELKLDNLSQ